MFSDGDKAIYQGRTVKVRAFVEGIAPKYDLCRIEWFDYRGFHQETVGASQLRIAKISGFDDHPKANPLMSTKTKLFKITEEQDEALSNLLEASKDKSLSDLVRRLLKEEAERLSVNWPDNMSSKEETMRRAQSQRWTKDKDDA